MNTDFELYRVFCEVVKYNNISKAANNMYISQSAVTQSIQKLEKILGGKVFYRSRTGVELTEEGKNLYEYIKDSIETMDNAENIFSKYISLEKGKIRIGGGNSLVSSLLIEPLSSFIKKYPNIKISINNGVTDNLMNKLSNGGLDMVVLNLPYSKKNYSNVEIIPVRKSKYCIFASKDFVKDNKIKSIEDLKDSKLILPKLESTKRKIFNDYCEKKNIEVNTNYEVSSQSVMKKLVINNVGAGFINMNNINDILDRIDIIEEIDIDNVAEGFAVLKKNMCNKATIEFIKEIKEYYKNN